MTSNGHSLYNLISFSSLKGSDTIDKYSGILRESRIDRLSTLHMTSEPCLFTTTFSSCEYFSAHQPINSGKGKVIYIAYGTMVSWNSSRNDLFFPTLSYRFLLDTEMGKMVISMLKIYESRSIRYYSLDTGYFFVTEVMIGSMGTMQNTWK
jgi:hypothetical protein